VAEPSPTTPVTAPKTPEGAAAAATVSIPAPKTPESQGSPRPAFRRLGPIEVDTDTEVGGYGGGGCGGPFDDLYANGGSSGSGNGGDADLGGSAGGNGGDADDGGGAVGGEVVPHVEQGSIRFQGEVLSFDDVARCTKCGFHVDPCAKGVRLMGKTPPTWRCAKCCTKQVMLHRMFGTWPLDDFKELDGDTQRAFWQSTGTDVVSLKKAVEHTLVRKLVEREIASEQGPFLPLAVGRTKGTPSMISKRRQLIGFTRCSATRTRCRS